MSVDKVGTRIGDISSLPDKLVSQLYCCRKDEEEQRILSVVESLEGIANLDEILIGLYNQFGLIYQRQKLVNLCYKFCKSGSLYRMDGQKGVYSLYRNAK